MACNIVFLWRNLNFILYEDVNIDALQHMPERIPLFENVSQYLNNCCKSINCYLSVYFFYRDQY